MPSSSPTEYRFSRYRLRPGERALLAHDHPVKLGGRALDVLLVLVQESERAVPKAELMERVWPNLVVEDNNLQVQIASLRKVLGPSAIVTIPGRGYRFTLPIEAQVAVAARPPPSTDPAGAPHDGLPHTVGPLYGRDEDLAAVNALLDQHVAISIVGAGGIGKTRLALAVASSRRARYPDGVQFVELAPVGDPARVVIEVARVLGLQPADGRSDVDVIADAVSQRDGLLLLDNCEHVLEAVAALADAFSRRAPGLRVLVTSQEPLKIEAERIYRLGPLAVPATTGAADAHSGAVALFVGRTQAVDPRFTLDAANVGAVLEICRRLDGIPLALELAAARVPLFGVEGLRARLDERFNILTGDARFVLRRHQTLRAALDFSYGLLDERERAVLRRVGVFAGSFALASAQRVCADDGLDEWEVLDCLGTLVDKSLVVAEAGAEPRLRLLETTRAYALEKLGDGGETDAVLDRHAAAMAALVEPMYGDFMALSNMVWLGRYAPDLDNLRAAIERSLRRAPDRAIALVGDSLKLWQELALHPEGRRYCAACLGLVTPATPPGALGRLWYFESMLAANAWPIRSRDAARKAIALLRADGDEIVLALALARLAAWSRGVVTQEQLDALEELRTLHRPQWSGQLKWLFPYAKSVVDRAMRRFEAAREGLERTLQIVREQGESNAEPRYLQNLAEVTLMAGDVDRSIQLAVQARERLERSHDRMFYMFATTALTTARLFGNDARGAREPLESAVPLILRYDMGYRFAHMAALYAALLGDLPAAARMVGYAEFAKHDREEFDEDPNELSARDRTLERLAGLPAEQLEAWRREGAASSAEDAFRAVLGSSAAPG